MICSVKFKGMDHSESLVKYVQERFQKICKFEIRPSHVYVTFQCQKHQKIAEVFIQGVNARFRAKASSDSYNESIDKCVKKIERQMEKEKSKIKKHRHRAHTDEAKLMKLIEQERKIKDAA